LSYIIIGVDEIRPPYPPKGDYFPMEEIKEARYE
jgi:hypothetical protein